MAAINTRVVRRTQGLLAAYSDKLKGHKHMLPPLPAGAAVAPPRYSPRAVAAELQEQVDAASSSASRAGAASPSSKIRDSASVSAPASSHATKQTLAYSPHFPFAYSEAMMLPVKGKLRSTVVGWITAVMMAVVNLVLSSPTLARLVHPFLPQPGTGGSAEAMNRAWFHYDVMAKCDDDRSHSLVRVAGCGDGGYFLTARMIVEGGILLATEKASLPCSAIGGGFLTPAVAHGRRLIEVLRPAGIEFEVLSVGQGPLPAARLREKGESPYARALKNKAQ